MKGKGLVAFLAGAIFAVGLAVSGMTQPAKVIGFLDFTGAWDPSLAFVMGGAVCLNLLLFRRIFARGKPVLEGAFHLPKQRTIDARLIVGSALLGAGWGIIGYCPGPALTSLVTGHAAPVVFVLAMAVGFVGHHLAETLLRAPAPANAKAGATPAP